MVMTRGKGGASKTKTYNKAKANRKNFKANSQKKYKSDFQSIQCATYLDTTSALNANDQKHGEGRLTNNAAIAANAKTAIAFTLALSPSCEHLACPTHSAYKGLFNEWRTSAVYIDLLINSKLRDVCDNVFILVERGDPTAITDVKKMVTDVNHKMYKCNNNIQSIKFKHIFADVRDKIFNKVGDDALDQNETIYLKVLAPINNWGAEIEAEDCQVTMRVKMFNQYKDMKVLTGANIPLN